MLINLTNSCDMGCPHCLNNCVNDNKHMSDEVLNKTLDIAEKLGVKVVVVSGGEPMQHPKSLEFIQKTAARGYKAVVVATNGSWMGNKEKDEGIMGLLRKFPHIMLQVTSIDGLYPRYEEVIRKVKAFNMELKKEGMKHRVMLTAEKLEGIVRLGRATDTKDEKVRMLMEQESSASMTMSCMSAALVSAQKDLVSAINILESRGKFCHPLVTWDGRISWSESVLCPHFATVKDRMEDIIRKAKEWRPCCRCMGYERFVEKSKKDAKYGVAKWILGI